MMLSLDAWEGGRKRRAKDFAERLSNGETRLRRTGSRHDTGRFRQSSKHRTRRREPVFLREITPRNFLSFGPETPPIELRSLNVLIGANGSGKSNLIEAIAFLRAAPKDFQAVTRSGGGVTEWIYKGSPDADASVSAQMNGPEANRLLEHTVRFRAQYDAFQLTNESIEEAEDGEDELTTHFLAVNNTEQIEITTGGATQTVGKEKIERGASIIRQFRDPERYPAFSYLAEQYDRIRIYRDWQIGPGSPLRRSQPADLRADSLEEDYSNLYLFLSRLRRYPEARAKLQKRLRDIYDGLTDFDMRIEGARVEVFFIEGSRVVPASRLPDGALRYLSLLAILCDPTPPPLICIDEPELGLHPDLHHIVADLLRDMAEQTQVLVTTHSSVIVDSMRKRPEAILVLDKQRGYTETERLNAEDLAFWIKEYSLGNLWRSGHLGGTRW